MTGEITTRKGTRVEIINGGNFLMDGGSMFGRVPKTLWQKKFPADPDNNIILATNIIRLSRDGLSILVDAGMGTRYTGKDLSIYGYSGQLPEGFPTAVDLLICTHLHFDHIGGVHDIRIRRDILVSEQEWQDARSTDPFSKGSYRKCDLAVVRRQLKLFNPPFEVLPGIEIIATPGHTAGHVAVLIDNEVLYPGDLIPTAAHVHLPWTMAWDCHPAEVIRQKTRLLRQAVAQGWTLIFEHDPQRPSARIEFSSNRFRAI